ncbi:toll/interleukin-1 receptor domain-containing protein [Pantoea endophytica]|uniref:Toll/interleukin-1 receptor domain-containing protein n=1 Tax=Pantoea sp. BJ2 TaxID=3141322 RepID=A0AAU7U418_9GAMM
MPQYFTKSIMRQLSSKRVNNYKSSEQVLHDSLRSVSDTEKFDVFLSHSSQDADLILGVKLFLESKGLKPYVDWVDDAQLNRHEVTRASAELLRKRMRQSHSLIYVVTDSSSQSRWMPWELGYFDGFRPKQVSVMPLLDYSQQSFQGQEYISLYPLISKSFDNSGYERIYVQEYPTAWTLLENFCSKSPSWRPY